MTSLLRLFRSRHELADGELSAYADGQVPAAARERVERHVAGCGACREKLRDFQSLRVALRGLPRAAAPRSFALREADVGPVRPQSGFVARAPVALTGLAVAAFVAFGVLVGIDASTLETGGGVNGANSIAASGPAAEQGPAASTPQAQSVEESTTGNATADEAPSERDQAGDSGALSALPGATPTPVPGGLSYRLPAQEHDADPSTSGRTPFRAAEAATAGIAVLALTSLALVSWRQHRRRRA